MPPAFVLSQDQTLKFIPGQSSLESALDPSKGLQNARIDAQASGDPRRRPRIPSHLLHLLNQPSPRNLPTQRGRAYKPSPHPSSTKIRLAGASAPSNRIGPIIQYHGVFCFGEEEPAFDGEAECCTR